MLICSTNYDIWGPFWCPILLRRSSEVPEGPRPLVFDFDGRSHESNTSPSASGDVLPVVNGNRIVILWGCNWLIVKGPWLQTKKIKGPMTHQWLFYTVLPHVKSCKNSFRNVCAPFSSSRKVDRDFWCLILVSARGTSWSYGQHESAWWNRWCWSIDLHLV
jgi:hypothetical protein